VGEGLLGLHGERGSARVYGGLGALPPLGSRGALAPEADNILALWKYICELFFKF